MVLSKDPKSELFGVGRSTFYQGVARIDDGVRAGKIHGVPAIRQHQLSLPRQMVDVVNYRWSIDEYEIKVEIVDDFSGVIEPTKLRTQRGGVRRTGCVSTPLGPTACENARSRRYERTHGWYGQARTSPGRTS
jgi:hypothetical protein